MDLKPPSETVTCKMIVGSWWSLKNLLGMLLWRWAAVTVMSWVKRIESQCFKNGRELKNNFVQLPCLIDESSRVTICHFLPNLEACNILLQNESIHSNKAVSLAEALEGSLTIPFSLTLALVCAGVIHAQDLGQSWVHLRLHHKLIKPSQRELTF